MESNIDDLMRRAPGTGFRVSDELLPAAWGLS